ncbi:MAG: DUF6603 domain-containing protein, partial [Acidobacteriota bacterium]|nr:DUF6603 domain-containing protein [Acidobacteriota bacterium]
MTANTSALSLYNADDGPEAATVTIPRDALDPLVGLLGEVAGLLVLDGDSYTVQLDWFENPVASLQDLPHDPEQRQRLLQLFGEVMGQVTGDSLGIPNQVEGRQWYPIDNPLKEEEGDGDSSSDSATGLYLVSEEKGEGDEQITILGLGAMHAFLVEGVEIRPYIYFPLLIMPPVDGQTFVLGDPAFPVELGVDVLKADGVFGTGEITFDGIKVASTVSFSDDPFSLDILLLNLKLPRQEAKDTSVGALLGAPADQWVSIASYLLVSQIVQLAPEPNRERFRNMGDALLGTLGLIGDVPPVDWNQLVADASQAPEIFASWLRTVASDLGTFRTWLGDWYAFFQGIDPAQGADHITGQGTRTDPFAIPLLTVADNGVGIAFTFATKVQESNKDLLVFPGLRLTPKAFQPLDDKPAVEVRLDAVTELMRLKLPGAGGAPPAPKAFPSFSALVVLANPTAAFTASGDPAETTDVVSIGSFQAGFSYRKPEGGDGEEGIYPTFMATEVQTPYGSWDAIDFTNFDDLMKNAGEVMASLVQTQLDAFFAATGDSVPAKMSKGMAATLGVTVPPGYTSATWPVDLLLFGPGGIEAIIADPLSALGGYFTRCLSTEVDGKTAWQQLLPQVAVVLGDPSAQDRKATGTGTEADPWEIQMFSTDPSTPSPYLQSWVVLDPGADLEIGDKPIVAMALTFKVPLPVSAVDLGFQLRADLLQMALPDAAGKGSLGTLWLPGARADFHLSGPGGTALRTPNLGGVAIEAKEITANLGWNRVPPPAQNDQLPQNPFYNHVTVAAVKLYANEALVDELGDIRFSFLTTEWTDEVLGQLTRGVFDAAGIWMLSHGGSFGVALTAAFGLLPDLSKVFNDPPAGGYPFALPEGLTLPPNWPRLAVSDEADGGFFVNPWDSLRQQLAAVYGDAATAVPWMRMLGWAVDETLPPVPDPQPEGTYADPWWVELDRFWQLQPLIWMAGEGASQALGFGVRRTMLSESSSAVGVKLEVTARVDLQEVSVASGAAVLGTPGVELPRGTLVATLTNPTAGQPLVQANGLVVGSAEVGFFVDAGGVTPIVNLYDSRFSAGEPLQTFDLTVALSGDEQEQVLETLLYATMTKLTEALSAVPAIQPLLAVLEDLTLVEAPESEGEPYGINLGSWRAMVADPVAFLGGRMQLVLQDGELLSRFYNDLAQLLGFESAELPAALAGLPDLLVALGLAEKQAGGYGLRLTQWVQLIQHPVAFLSEQGRALLDPADPGLRQALVSALSQLPAPPPPLSDAPLTISENTLITLRIPADKLLNIGEYLQVDASLTLNLQALTLTASVVLTSIQARADLRFDMIFNLAEARAARARGRQLALASIDPQWALSLSGAEINGVPSPFEPIAFYPLPDQTSVQEYLAQLGLQVPVLLASSIGSQLINDFAIGDGQQAKYPVIYRILQGLGLTVPSANGGLDQVQSLAGIFLHPIDWILSEPVLGNGQGGFDLAKVGQALYAVPGPDGVAGPGSIRLEQESKGDLAGMALTGLPYGTSMSFTSGDPGIAFGMGLSYTFSGDGLDELTMVRAAEVEITPSIEMSGQLLFGKGSGVKVSGEIIPSFLFDSEGPTTLSVRTAYDAGFELGLWGTLNGTRFPPEEGQWVELVPFGGLSQFQAGITAILDYATGQLVTLYDDFKTEHPQSPVVTITDNVMGVVNFFGITSVQTLHDTFQLVSTDPLDWLISFFRDDKLPATLEQIDKLMSPDYLNLPGFSYQQGATVITYTPAFPAALGEMSVDLGSKDGVFGVFVAPKVTRDWALLQGSAGIGFETPLQVGAPLRFDLQVDIGVAKDAEILPAQLPGAPVLLFGLDVGTASDLQYFLRFYPLGEGSAKTDLLIGLLPPPPYLAYGDNPTQPVPATDWLLTFTTYFLVPFLADMVLSTEQVAGWLNAPLLPSDATSPPPGPILASWGLLVQDGDPPDAKFTLHDLITIWTNQDGERLSPLQIVERLFLAVLEGLSGKRVLAIGENGGIYIEAQDAEGGAKKDYGLRVTIPDIVVIGSAANGEDSAGTVQVLIQLGKFLSVDERSSTNWIQASDPAVKFDAAGAYFFLVRNPTAGEPKPEFHPRVQLVSLGLDVRRANGEPLVDYRGLLMGSIEPRTYLSLDFASLSDTSVGGAIQVGGIGVPLGKDTIDGVTGNTNPVAENLLATGEAPDDDSTQATNPTFSMAMGYVHDPKNDTNLFVRLCDDDATSCDDNFIWLAMQRAFGPVHCRQIGFGWEGPEKRLLAGFDGNVSLLGLALTLIRLKVGIPVTTPLDYKNYTLDLEGIDLSFKGGPVEISGGFLKTTKEVGGEEVIVYTGLGMIKASKFALTAIGSYGLIGQNTPSLFIFAALSVPIGGPPYFFVKGLAGGFGFNRNLDTPRRAADIFDFPFVKGVVDPSYFSGNNADVALERLSTVSEPERGAYWLAAGIEFSSFQMINAFALLTVTFGVDFELNLLGMATIELPVTVDGGDSYSPIARAELALLVAFRPSEGLLAVEAALSANSYVIDKAARLTGGFAFFIWYPPSPHAGEFVITLGGYHPRFDPPEYYPDEPRLGFSWLLPQYGVTIEGGAYFALVPTAVMAGGFLRAQYKAGNLKAWFNAQADMLISWKPFYFDVFIGIRVGASYKVDLLFVSKTFSVELGAELNLWGPPTGGKVRVSWWVLSFTISFGPGRESKRPLGWPEFDQSFLPQPQEDRVAAARLGTLPPRDPRLEARVPRGLVQSIIDEATGEVLRWIINPQDLELETALQVPAVAAEFNGAPVATVLVPIPGSDPVEYQEVPFAQATTDLGIVPMKVSGLNTDHRLTLSKNTA